MMPGAMAKVTLFVPDEVFEQMQAARTKTGPNWSQVATEAFRRTLHELKEARSTMAPAVRLPYPTTGDYEVFEVRRGRSRFQVKVSGTVCAPNYVHARKLPRIVAAFAEEIIDADPSIGDGGTLPKVLTSSTADAIAARL
jgi:hypothetical protein